MLWREWHRNRPSRLARAVMAVYVAAAMAGLTVGIYVATAHGTSSLDVLELTDFLTVDFGLLILSATAPTVLTEERMRGSLDVVMCTPLSTRTIVLGKWWALYRRWLPLALVPLISSLFVATAVQNPSMAVSPFVPQYVPIDNFDRLALIVLPTAFTLAHSAAATSLGLAMATWVKRTGPAVALCVAIYLFMVIGWVVLVESLVLPLWRSWGATPFLTGLTGYTISDQTFSYVVNSASPMGSQILPFNLIQFRYFGITRHAVWAGQAVVLTLTFGMAACLIGLTLATFNRCLGRIAEHPGPARLVVLRADRRPPT